ncbi:hypothetical protein ABIE69_000945 [Rhodobacteraceae bacterium MBR-64]|jgi:hypothetical protein
MLPGHNYTRAWALAAALALWGGAAAADTISPETFSAELAVGESVTIEKTVVIESTGPTDALVDAMFLIDTSGSMGGAIGGAKAAAGSLLSGLSSTFNLQAGVGVFSEGNKPGNGDGTRNDTFFNLDLTADTTTVQSALNAVTLGVPDGGGDFPERGQDAVNDVANKASWRPGSNRFIFALGDASWKNDLVSDAVAQAAVDGANVTLVGLRFSNFSASDPASDDSTFAQSVEDLGGTVFNSGTSAEDIIANVTAGIAGGFANYSNVTVGDLGTGLPEIALSVVCTSADTGACAGADATGAFDRSIDRTFTFDVTFTRLAEGDKSFDTFALVNGGIVATEGDSFTTAPVPLPAAGWLMLSGLFGLGAVARRRRKM